MQQKLGLSTRLSQRLILTPSLQQAIKLLPLTTLELAEVLEQEVMENPLLEEVPVQETNAEEVANAPADGIVMHLPALKNPATMEDDRPRRPTLEFQVTKR